MSTRVSAVQVKSKALESRVAADFVSKMFTKETKDEGHAMPLGQMDTAPSFRRSNDVPAKAIHLQWRTGRSTGMEHALELKVVGVGIR